MNRALAKASLNKLHDELWPKGQAVDQLATDAARERGRWFGVEGDNQGDCFELSVK